MFRLIGFLIGSAASIGAIVLLLGIPEFHLSNPQLDKSRFDEALSKLREKKTSAQVAARDTAEKLSETVDELLDKPGDAAVPSIPVEEEPAQALVAEANQQAITTAAALAIDTAAAHELQWHSFWNPFRSEIAAKGFVSQLEKVTGLDYRVVRIKTGVYEVAFAYGNDSERRTRLSQITAATGLELPGS